MSDPRTPAAVGFSVHTGWAVAVAVTGPPPRVLARREVDLAGGEARFVYHAAAEKRDQAAEVIGRAEAVARDRAAAFLRQLGQELPDYALVVALPRPKRALPPVAAILQSHPLIHSAEGELFRRSIAEAATRLGMGVKTPEPGQPALIGKMSPPWGKDQKDAAALAWAALTDREGTGGRRS